MPSPELTPEDRLLEIIENPPKHAAGDGAGAPAGRARDLAGLTDLVRSFDVRVWWVKGDLGYLNKFIMAVSMLLTVVCVWQFKNSMDVFDAKFAAVSVAGEAKSVIQPVAAVPGVDFERVMSLARKHNIFSLNHDMTNAEGLFVGNGQETANLKLVGILWSDNPQAMVEDTLEQKTHLLSVGDQVAHLTVKTITKDKVILSKDDRVWELR